MVRTAPTTMPVRIFCMRVRGWRGLPGVVGVRAPPGRWGSVPAGVVVTSAGPFRLYVRGSAVVGAPGVGGDEAADECGRPQPVGGGEHGEAAEPVPGEGGAELAAHRVFLRSGGRPRGGSFRGGGRAGGGVIAGIGRGVAVRLGGRGFPSRRRRVPLRGLRWIWIGRSGTRGR